MSVLSRAAAPPATGEVAAVVAALLSNLDHAPPARLAVPEDAESREPPPEKVESEAAQPVPADLGGMVGAAVPHRLLGPTGLGAPYLPKPPGLEATPAAGSTNGAPPAADSGTEPDHAAAQSDSADLDDPGSSSGRGINSALDQLLSGRTDLTRLRTRVTRTDTTTEDPTSPGATGGPQRSGGPVPAQQSAIPPLYCPPPVRDDPALAAAVNEGILLWAETIGLYEGKLDELRKADFGRLIMLAHPDCDDPDRLLAVAKCAVSEWSVDDYYCEEDADDRAPDGTPSSAEAELGPRLELAAAAIDPVHLPARYQAQLERALQADPILRAFRTSFEHLSHYATPAQLARLRTEIGGWFIALGAEAGWRAADRMPPVWEYLTNRQPHSFLPCMAPIDVVGGYELSAPEYTDPRVRRLVTTAALAAQMVNDLYSMAREDLSGGREFNLPTVFAAEEQCPRRAAVRRTAEIHDELVHRFEREASAVAATGSPALRRFLGGLWAWMGGNRAWHADSRRYHEKD
ncbi:family 2 encapsulin nanocompartment cargo protein terpene cyclase [Nocardia mexicana]|uniref:2-methylisoborneol synthase n=1 Tax=Nocardia mexicana TaxID=279262 RepID=A0A370H1T8_9NOCA|nr:family 2 encapsulin nanocompartment cargo protein terpene cyclase [Nocardia mexicana]RDI49588.1 2-methylisoborneol synthase [Nocardia mexicana]